MNVKPLVVTLFFLSFLCLIASGLIGSSDLTPDTPPAPTSTAWMDLGVFRPPMNAVGSGPCGNFYIVQKGDTLSGIACLCGLSLGEVLAINPAISNPNLIYPGQRLEMPSVADQLAQEGQTAPGAVPQPTAAAPPTAPTAAEIPTSPPATVVPTAAPTQAPAAAPPSGQVGGAGHAAGTDKVFMKAAPGAGLSFELTGLPANTRVQLEMGSADSAREDNAREDNAREDSAREDSAREDSARLPQGEATTDGQGHVQVNVTLPEDAPVGEVWWVFASPKGQPQVQVTSLPFLIIPR